MKTQTIVEQLIALPPFSLEQSVKQALFIERLQELSVHHYQNGSSYRNIVDRVFGGITGLDFSQVEAVPFLPVSLFKTHELRSVSDSEVVKVLTSSGTTGQTVSKVYLDQDTSNLQAKVLVKIMQQILGKERMPMVILDHASVIRNRESYSARGAGILGMAQFGRSPFYALREDMSLDIEGLLSYLEKVNTSKIFFFGFTFMVWQHFLLALEAQNIKLKLEQSILVHSGGWKKLQEQAVTADVFRSRLQDVIGMQRIINFYGMVEQVGGVFVENSAHYLHASNFSDVIIRDPLTLMPVPNGTVGLVQLMSPLPTSYPGHSILTEDLGVIRGADDPSLGMNGKYFEIVGRAPKSELRGCSDTFQGKVLS